MEEGNNDIINQYTHSLAEKPVDMMQNQKLWTITRIAFVFDKTKWRI